MSKETFKVPGEGFVVTKGGVRVDGQVHVDESTAQAEAAKHQRKLQETGGAPAEKVEVKNQLFG